MKVVFFGTPLFAAHVLTYLLEENVEIVAVISKPDRPKGRSGNPLSTPVKLAAQSFNPQIPIHQPEIVSDLEIADILRSYNADLFVVVAYGEIIKQHLLDMPRVACINLHTSLLPKYRGAAPIQRAIIAGEIETGVTVMHMVKKMDAGDIIKVDTLEIPIEMTFGELEQELCEMGKKLLLETIREFETGIPERFPQEHSLATFAPKIELEDCEINWKRSAQELHDLIRGVNPYPGAWCYIQIRGEKKRLKIQRTKIVPSTYTCLPGTIINLTATKGNLVVSTGDQWLELQQVQLEGKRSMSSEELTRGYARSELIFHNDV